MFRAANAIAAMQLRFIAARHRPDVVMVTAPECFAWLGKSSEDAVLGYDCMDDAIAFAQDSTVRALKAACERSLLARADFVACTTETLLQRLIARGANADKLRVIANGWDPSAFPLQSSRPLPPEGPLALGYFGAIGEWLDFESIEALTTALPEVTIRLIGPNLCGYVSPHARLTLEPPVEHAGLADKVGDLDVLLLPFRVTELTRAVDPVKLYEYIALGRPILAMHYPELQRFAAFVTFYRDTDELLQQVRERSGPSAQPAPLAERKELLLTARWSDRAHAVAALIDTQARGRRLVRTELTQ